MVNPSETNLVVQAAVKNTATNTVFFFNIPVALETLMVPGIVMEVQALAAAWRSIDETQEVSQVVNDMSSADRETIQQKLTAKDICFVANREVPGQEGQSASFFSCRTMTNASFLVELKFRKGFNACKVTVKSPNKAMSDLLKATVARIIIS
jgi:hypothetical protein